MGTPASWRMRALYTHASSESDIVDVVYRVEKNVEYVESGGKCRSPVLEALARIDLN